jgi:hypothetical protein
MQPAAPNPNHDLCCDEICDELNCGFPLLVACPIFPILALVLGVGMTVIASTIQVSTTDNHRIGTTSSVAIIVLVFSSLGLLSTIPFFAASFSPQGSLCSSGGHLLAIVAGILPIAFGFAWIGIAFAFGEIDSMYAAVVRECLPDGLPPRPICNGWILTLHDNVCENANQTYESTCHLMDVHRTYITSWRIPFREIESCEWRLYQYACQGANCGRLHQSYGSIRGLTIAMVVLLPILIINFGLLCSSKGRLFF